MTDRTTVQTSGVGFLGLLAILFIGLKLGAVIDWSWWWVLASLGAPWAVVFALLAAFGVGARLFSLVALAFTAIRK